MSSLTSLNRPISPPPKASRSKPKENTSDKNGPRPAAVEAGEVHIEDHLAYSSNHLRKVLRLTVTSIPRLSIDQFVQLYQRNQTSNGHHFIIHQHDHPVSGVHYDLRLQFSDSSSISFAVPYGMPGDANSRRQLRMAIETRVHNLWNHLIESASHATGSLLIWNIGEYEILPKQAENAVETDDENSEKDDASSGDQDSREEPTKLLEAFKAVRSVHLGENDNRLMSTSSVTCDYVYMAPNFPKTTPSTSAFHQPMTILLRSQEGSLGSAVGKY